MQILSGFLYFSRHVFFCLSLPHSSSSSRCVRRRWFDFTWGVIKSLALSFTVRGRVVPVMSNLCLFYYNFMALLNGRFDQFALHEISRVLCSPHSRSADWLPQLETVASYVCLRAPQNWRFTKICAWNRCILSVVGRAAFPSLLFSFRSFSLSRTHLGRPLSVVRMRKHTRSGFLTLSLSLSFQICICNLRSVCASQFPCFVDIKLMEHHHIINTAI